MKKIKISELKSGTSATIHAWVDKIRNQKSIQFIILRDREGKVQMTVNKEKFPLIAEIFETLPLESTVRVEADVVSAPQVKLGGIEIIPSKVEVTSIAKVSPIDEGSSLDLLLDYRWLDLRNDIKLDYFKVQTEALRAMRDWFVQNGYIEIMTPKLTQHASEGGAEVFSVDYFDQKAYLTQSPQLFKQMAIASGFERVFEIGACYRAEKSHTSRHATEFFALDVEMGFVDNEQEVMDVEEEMIKHVLAQINKNCQEILARLGLVVEVPTARFPRITLLEAYDLLENERGYIVPRSSKGDLDPEAERLLCEISREKWKSDFIFITNFPSSARAFYIKRTSGNTKLTHGFDLLYKGVELTSGGQREHSPEELRKNLVDKGINPKDMEFYIQFFEYGCPPHGGFALGLARLFARILGLPNVKDTTFLFRGPTRLSP